MSPEIKRGRLKPLIRRAQPEDLQAQVRALKELQKQPAFIAGKAISKAKSQATFKKKFINIVLSIFRHKQKRTYHHG